MVRPSDRIPDHEFIYHRIPWPHYSNPAELESRPQVAAFLPSHRDTDGVSVDIASLTTIERAATGRGKRYHLARLHVGIIRKELGLHVLARPILRGNAQGYPENPAHAIIPELNRQDYERDKSAMQAVANRLICEFSDLVLVALDPVEFPGVAI